MAEGAGAAGLRRAARGAGALSRAARRSAPVRRQYRSAHSRLHHGARTRTRDRVVSFRLTFPDRPGLLGQIATRLGELGANILEVDHKRLFLDVPAKGTRLDVTVETRDRAHADDILAALERGWLPAVAHRVRRCDGSSEAAIAVRRTSACPYKSVVGGALGSIVLRSSAQRAVGQDRPAAGRVLALGFFLVAALFPAGLL